LFFCRSRDGHYASAAATIAAMMPDYATPRLDMSLMMPLL